MNNDHLLNNPETCTHNQHTVRYTAAFYAISIIILTLPPSLSLSKCTIDSTGCIAHLDFSNIPNVSICVSKTFINEKQAKKCIDKNTMAAKHNPTWLMQDVNYASNSFSISMCSTGRYWSGMPNNKMMVSYSIIRASEREGKQTCNSVNASMELSGYIPKSHGHVNLKKIITFDVTDGNGIMTCQLSNTSSNGDINANGITDYCDSKKAINGKTIIFPPSSS